MYPMGGKGSARNEKGHACLTACNERGREVWYAATRRDLESMEKKRGVMVTVTRSAHYDASTSGTWSGSNPPLVPRIQQLL